MTAAFPYIGGKNRIAPQISVYLHATGGDCLVDVFGGSAAVLLNSGFEKRVYNDIDGDLVNLFKVIGDDHFRPALLKLIRLTPPSREIFEDHYRDYVAHGLSFGHVSDPVERAFRIFYRLQFAFGGKLRSGGFTLSTGDRTTIKEILRYRNSLKRLAGLAGFFRDTAIEHLDFSECISIYGRRSGVVLFVDPPYIGTENYYSRQLSRADHAFLAHQLACCKAPVVCTYYDAPEIRELYSEAKWQWSPIETIKNSQRKGGQNKAIEWVLSRKTAIANDRKPNPT
jgi:DNA adenine methylase